MKNIVLIGMPSSGKTTIGSSLAQSLGTEFADTDSIIRDKAGKPLKDIVNEDGLEQFLKIQEDTILETDFRGYIIATGGSVIYGSGSMKHLKNDGIVVFLKTPLNELEERITPDRRFAKDKSKDLSDLYAERMPLYEKYADLTVECSGKEADEIVQEIIKSLNL